MAPCIEHLHTAFYVGRNQLIAFFAYDNSGLISFFTYQPEIFVVLMPAATMRLWADERRSGTIEFLLTQPVDYTAVVLGKFMAAAVFGLLMLALTLPFALYASTLVDLDMLNVLSAYLPRFWLLRS